MRFGESDTCRKECEKIKGKCVLSSWHSVVLGLFPGGKVARASRWPPIPFQGQRWVQLYLYLTSVPPWHVTGQPLPLPLDIGGCEIRANVGRQHQKHLFTVLIWEPEGIRPHGRPLIIWQVNLQGYSTWTFCGWSWTGLRQYHGSGRVFASWCRACFMCISKGSGLPCPSECLNPVSCKWGRETMQCARVIGS